MPTDTELEQIKQMLDMVENHVRQVKNLLFSKEIAKKASELNLEENGNFVEGVFDGEKMIGPNKKKFEVPANYASKSKLVSGDVLKLTILPDGSFLYKQIGPIERKKMVGTLKEISPKNYVVECGSAQYRVLPASITYFKASEDDKLTILVPKDNPSEWAAVENIIES